MKLFKLKIEQLSYDEYRMTCNGKSEIWSREQLESYLATTGINNKGDSNGK